jgi:hypothetical protein
MAVSLAQLLENQAPVHPFALNEPIGSLLNFPWLKIKGVLSSLSTQQIRNAINENKEWFVAEKLDGCNVSASSAGWIATRKQIAGHLIQEKQFGKRKIQNVTMEKLRPIFDKIFTLGDDLNRDYDLGLDLTKKDQLILYGEYILPGTATTEHDIYDNKRNGFKVGQMYVFGVGFVFENQQNSENKAKLQKFFPNVIEMRSQDEELKYFLCPINRKNRNLFLKSNIDLVPFQNTEKFVNLLTRRNKANLIDQLDNRKLEGFVLHDSTNQIFKWKYQVETTDYYDALVEAILKEWCANENEVKVANALAWLYNQSREYVTQLDLPLFEYYFDEFMVEHEKTLRSRVIQSLGEKDLKFIKLGWCHHALTVILYKIRPESKYAFDKKILMEYESLIMKKIDDVVFDIFN